MRLDIAARAYLAWGGRPVPFLHQGRNPDVGIDCIGLLILAARDCGHDLTAYAADYPRHPHHGLLQKHMAVAFGLPVRELSPGCVVTIDYKGATRHVAIVGEHRDGLSLIHTASNVKHGKELGKVVEHRIDRAWRNRITGIYSMERA